VIDIWIDFAGLFFTPRKKKIEASYFTLKQVTIVLKKEDIVPNMHEAYKRCHSVNYGSFLTGPSNTADIEESLVIGAHGAWSLTLFFIISFKD